MRLLSVRVLASLPDRQLRKLFSWDCGSPRSSLPDRQLRNANDKYVAALMASLPDRQLRKNFVLANS